MIKFGFSKTPPVVSQGGKKQQDYGEGAVVCHSHPLRAKALSLSPLGELVAGSS